MRMANFSYDSCNVCNVMSVGYEKSSIIGSYKISCRRRWRYGNKISQTVPPCYPVKENYKRVLVVNYVSTLPEPIAKPLNRWPRNEWENSLSLSVSMNHNVIEKKLPPCSCLFVDKKQLNYAIVIRTYSAYSRPTCIRPIRYLPPFRWCFVTQTACTAHPSCHSLINFS